MDPKPPLTPGNMEEVERIKQAAIRVGDGTVLTGNSHEEIFTINFEKYFNSPIERTMGFITTTGRFVLREEAAEIAFKAGQIKKKVQSLTSQVLHLK